MVTGYETYSLTCRLNCDITIGMNTKHKIHLRNSKLSIHHAHKPKIHVDYRLKVEHEIWMKALSVSN